ncbi:MAG: (Fe-S)-binding protein [Deltaproteobacteria bacterium]
MTKEKTALAPSRCAKCGACAPVCPLYKLAGRESLTARGKLHLLQKIPLTEAEPGYAEILSKCLLCGACSSICPRNLDIPSQVYRARANLKPGLVSTPLSAEIIQAGMRNRTMARLLSGATRMLDRSVLRLLPKDSGLRFRLSLPDIEATGKVDAERGSTRRIDLKVKAEKSNGVSIFEGCHARYLQREITQATTKLLQNQFNLSSVNPGEQQCCGLAFCSAGQSGQAIELAKRNIEAFASCDGPILVTCASCFSHLASYPSLFSDDPVWQDRAGAFAARLREFSTFLLDQGLTKKLKRTTSGAAIYFHDSCHLKFHCKITKPPRALLKSVASLRIAESAEGYLCCGAGGLFQLYHPDLAARLQSEVVTTIAALKVSHTLTTCSGCLLHLYQGLTANRQPIKVQHLAVFLAELFS